MSGGGWVDAYRKLYPKRRQYTQGGDLRIDYCLVNREMYLLCKDAIIRDEVKGSDHVPIELVIYIV